MWLHGTNETIKTLNDFYMDYYKEIFNSYLVELDFTTILTYYSGSCALVVDIHSSKEAAAETDMCIMLECNESDIKDLDETAMHNLFTNKIIQKYKGLLELNKVLCSRPIGRRIIIKNTNFNESILSFKVEKEVMQIELNYNKMIELNKSDRDLLNAIDALSIHFDKT